MVLELQNFEIVWMLNELADLLEIKGENQFKIRAYRNAARSISRLEQNISGFHDRNELKKIPGIGSNIADKIIEFLETGTLAALSRLREEVPEGLMTLTRLPGVGLKSAKAIHENFGVKDTDDIERLAKEHKIRSLPGLGPKTELNILRGIQMLKQNQESSPLYMALASGEIFADFLRGLKEVSRVEIVGSVRRGKEMVGNVNILAGASDFAPVIDAFSKHPHLKQVSSAENNRVKGVSLLGVNIDLILVSEEKFIQAFHFWTGSREHLEQLTAAQRGRNNGWQSDIAVTGEEDIYAALGLPYIQVELREGSGEVEAALNNLLPDLVNTSDIQGDLHVHSTWSDGISTIEELVQEAINRGYSYIAITDHSKSLAIANGLDEERLLRQGQEIRRLREKYSPFLILHGIEVDILSDSRLDFEDSVLAQLDIVVASIHTGFKQDEETLARRLNAAMENPFVDIIAHPTGRILGRRPPYKFALDTFIEKAAVTGAVLEINASPDRLDLNAEQVRKAKENGVKIAIDTDAHDRARLGDIKFGVITARRGWLEKEDVINCLSPAELLDFLAQRRRKAVKT